VGHGGPTGGLGRTASPAGAARPRTVLPQGRFRKEKIFLFYSDSIQMNLTQIQMISKWN
jgi:hypothetical protein